MNLRPNSSHVRSLCLLVGGLLLVASQVFAQHTREDKSLRDEEGMYKSASLSLRVTGRGAATVMLALTSKPDDPAALEKSLSESLGFPLHVDDERRGYDEEENESWWLINAHNDHAYLPQGLLSRGRIDMAPLVSALRSLGIKYFSASIFFENKFSNLRMTGATKLEMQRPANLGRSKITIPEIYTARINIDAPEPTPIEFSWGYSPADIMRQLMPLSAFVLLPLLFTLWMSRSVLSRKEADPRSVWGRYFRYLYRLMTLIWLVWLPVSSWTNIGEMFSMAAGYKHNLLLEVAGVALYFLPPLLVVWLCHLLSSRVYRHVRDVEWSPRDVVKKAILANALNITPFFFVVLAFNTFVAKSRYAGLFLILGVAGWVLFARLAGKAFNLSSHAVTSGELRDRIFALAGKAGVKLQQIYVLSAAQGQLANAFARSDNAVMLTASLLRHLSKREVDAIMAHEIGHLKEGHPQTRVRVTVATIVVANIVGASLSSMLNLEHWAPAVFSFSLAASIFVVHFLSRSNERHADSIAINLTGDPEAFITGLAKISRLNLMPLHAGGWAESIETHPATMRRLQDVAGYSGISPQRLKELLDAPAGEEERYGLVQIDEAKEKIFSTAFKSKYIFRISWAILATVIGAPVSLAFMLPRLQLQGPIKWAVYAGGLLFTFGLYQLVRNFASFWGYGSLQQGLRAKLGRQGFLDAAGDGVLVGFAPASEPRKYEGYLLWDAGLLQLTDDRLCYVGEETRFALRRGQVLDIYLGDSQPLWLRQKHLYIRWRDEEHGAGGTFYLLAAEKRSLLQARCEVKSLYRQLQGWLKQETTYPAATSPLLALTSPNYSVVTSQPIGDRSNRSSFLTNTLLLACLTFLLGLALRLSLSGIGYALAAVVTVCLLDRLPKLLERAAVGRTPIAAPTEDPEEVGTYERGAWAKSET